MFVVKVVGTPASHNLLLYLAFAYSLFFLMASSLCYT